MPFKGSLEDRVAIRELIDGYSDAVIQRDERAWGANWAEDAVWNLMGMEVKGRSSIVGAWNQAMSGFSFVAFFANPGDIHVDGDRAKARVYTTELLVETGGKFRHIVGQYDDEMIKQSGRWLFSKREYRILRDM
jgi:uncharacterized protein (TIGR02246 family)